jgi:catechol 2,3-dioxygenase-like lactoylglutathione lyase family enzyme
VAPVRIGKLFHLTLLTDDFAAPQHFFNSVFSPMCVMHGYTAHWHRHGAIYIVADTSLEPMHVLPPNEGEVGTSWYRYMERYGPRVHNLAFYVDDPAALTERLEAAGVRTTNAGAGETVFAHPKDTPGMLEFCLRTPHIHDPRFDEGWDAFRRSYWSSHPLTLERMSHVTVLVQDVDQATAFFVDLLDGVPLPDQSPTLPGSPATFVLVGEDTILELTTPADPTSPAGRDLEEVGQGAWAATFKVGDVVQAEKWLRNREQPIVSTDADTVVLDRAKTWGLEFRFTSRALDGDPRA